MTLTALFSVIPNTAMISQLCSLWFPTPQWFPNTSLPRCVSHHRKRFLLEQVAELMLERCVNMTRKCGLCWTYVWEPQQTPTSTGNTISEYQLRVWGPVSISKSTTTKEPQLSVSMIPCVRVPQPDVWPLTKPEVRHVVTLSTPLSPQQWRE